MADMNVYIRYKRNQRLLVYWIANTSNRIINKTRATSEETLAVLTTGEISLPTLKSLSALIAEHVKPIPGTIFRLFQYIIEARKETHRVFLRIAASTQDPETQKNNASHKHWIDGMTEAFNALGGELWLSEQRYKSDVSEEDEEEVIFANRFSTLSVDESSGEDEGGENEDDNHSVEQNTAPATAEVKKKPTKKAKKGRRGRMPKTGTKTAAPASTPSLDQVPLENYRIIDDDGFFTECRMAIYAFVYQWVELRHYLQGIWREVAYKGLNSAVAASLSNIAIGMIKDTQSQIAVDFPGHDSFEAIIDTLPRGGPDRAQGVVRFHKICSKGDNAKISESSVLDANEEFLIHCYQDLLDFITDFQQTGSGKPTKNMAKDIQSWDPTLDLQSATKEQRLRWRRAYTINWLYDLANVNSSFVVQRRSLRRQIVPLESVDWSANGPWQAHRRLFGITEFAGAVTHFAVQKPGTDIRPRILPHHVFQLQCIVDSLAVSRGWSNHALKGHTLSPPASEFHPGRDIDSFMDRNRENDIRGYCPGVDMLSRGFARDALIHGDDRRHKNSDTMIRELRDDFMNWLGESKCMHGLKTIPPSRFSHANANGLWEYSPFLCGAGLVEALGLAYKTGLILLDRVPESLCAIHLHNMLVKKGYLPKPVPLYYILGELFKKSFFADGNVPTSNFEQALRARVGSPKSRRERRELGRNVAKTAKRSNGFLDNKMNNFFKAKSLLCLYHAADWIPDRISDEDVPIHSRLALLRLLEAKQVTDPATGKVRLEDIDLVKRARSSGIDDAYIIDVASEMALASMGKKKAQATNPELESESESIDASLPGGPNFVRRSPNLTHRGTRKWNLAAHQYLDVLKLDFLGEICGMRQPITGVNYVMVVARFMYVFIQVENELSKGCNPLWLRAYGGDAIWGPEKRLSLTMMVLEGEDEESMRVFADALQNPEEGFINYMYWLAEDLPTQIKRSDKNINSRVPDDCTVM